MRTARRLLPVTLTALLAWSAPAAGATGGASADQAEGGPLFAGALSYGAPVRQRPVARVFKVVPGSVREGSSGVRLKVRVDEKGVDRVSARVVAIDSSTRRVGARFSLGRIRTGRTLKLVWPRRHVPSAGRYLVRLHVKDPQGATLARAARATGKSRLVVRPRPRPESPQPEPQIQPTPVTPIGGGVFPVAGRYTFGGDDGRFGAGRRGHTHEGQDISAAEGTPVVSPLPGVVRIIDNQPSGAGWYIVLTADDGRELFFAHLQTNSIGVLAGQRVAAGHTLARVGKTGSATGPHLHFEIWEGGWRDKKGRPVDPLPQLLAWAAAS
jgi:murein DD-endopeptidase MepM/ murein hydrolase activator NlpD